MSLCSGYRPKRVGIDVSFDYNAGDNARGVPAMCVNKNKGLGGVGETKSKELLSCWAKSCSLSKNWPNYEGSARMKLEKNGNELQR
ncbi:hypothetical protein BCT27_24760 [Enterovibrio norvegicus]|nr:hypothetical protein BCT27_24760 [Enterovibrio norvegicus]